MSTQEPMPLSKIVGRHLMCVSVVFELYDDNGKLVQPQQTAAYTCFPMEVRGVILLVTAGHVVNDELVPLVVNKKIAGLNVRVLGVRLCDFFGVEEEIATKMTTPFSDFEGTPRFALDRTATDRQSDGIDIGCFILKLFFWRGILANGVYSVPEEMWAQPGETFERYVVGGFPNEPALRARNEVRTTAYLVSPGTDPGVRVVNGEPVWFVGDLAASGTSIVGVSGGPIFGFQKIGENLWRHKLVGIQSWEDRSRGQIYGTPISALGKQLTGLVTELVARGAQSEEQ